MGPDFYRVKGLGFVACRSYGLTLHCFKGLRLKLGFRVRLAHLDFGMHCLVQDGQRVKGTA